MENSQMIDGKLVAETGELTYWDFQGNRVTKTGDFVFKDAAVYQQFASAPSAQFPHDTDARTEYVCHEDDVIEWASDTYDGPSMKDQVTSWGYESVEDFYAQTGGVWEF